MLKNLLLIVTACLGGSPAFGGEWQGRVLDMQRQPLAGAKVMLQPSGLVAFTDGNGIFKLSEAASIQGPVFRPSAFPSLAGPRLGFQADPGFPAADPIGRRFRPQGSGWLMVLPIPSRTATAPDGHLFKLSASQHLSAEKPGYLPARISLAAGETVRDIVLTPTLGWTGTLSSVPTPQVQPLLSNFPLGNTSTDLPNLTITFKRTAAEPNADTYILKWELRTEDSVRFWMRPHDHAPASPEREEFLPPDGITSHDRLLEAGVVERVPAPLEAKSRWGEYVNLLLWKRIPGSDYGAMKWMHFLGPIPAIQKWNNEDTAQGFHPAALYSGTVPPLDTCGRLAGKVVWKGPEPFPELWIGMLGTGLFSPVAADGSFQTTDLPPGNPPLALFRVTAREFGSVTARTFYPLPGVTIVSGQTSVLDSLVLSGD